MCVCVFVYVSVPKAINSYATKNLKNKAIFDLKQYCMHCFVTLSNVF